MLGLQQPPWGVRTSDAPEGCPIDRQIHPMAAMTRTAFPGETDRGPDLSVFSSALSECFDLTRSNLLESCYSDGNETRTATLRGVQ